MKTSGEKPKGDDDKVSGGIRKPIKEHVIRTVMVTLKQPVDI